MRISDWSSDVCSSDLVPIRLHRKQMPGARSDHPVLPTGTNERSTIPRPLIIRHSRHRDRVAARTKLSSAERRRRRGAADANDIASRLAVDGRGAYLDAANRQVVAEGKKVSGRVVHG